MSMKDWERKVLAEKGAGKRVGEIEDELRLAAGLTAFRERAGMTQRELAEAMGVSQPRVAAIEKSHNVTVDVLDAYVTALGGRLEVTVVRGGRRTKILGATVPVDSQSPPGSSNAFNHRSRKRADSAESAEKPGGTGQLSGTGGTKRKRTVALPR